MKTKSVILLLLMICSLASRTINRTVTGKVTDNNNQALSGVNVLLKGTHQATSTDAKGNYQFEVPDTGGTLVFTLAGYAATEVSIGSRAVINVTLQVNTTVLNEMVITEQAPTKTVTGASYSVGYKKDARGNAMPAPDYETQPQWNTEEYDAINENIFHDALKNPLSTFSIDVDAASYSNIRRFINDGQRPPKDAVRIEEMINYFHYDYDQPTGSDPFAIHTQLSDAPWNPQHKLVLIGLQGKRVPTDNLPPSNLVFLIDVSGSMDEPNKLPLLISSFKMLVQNLREQDHVAIVVYAGAAGLVLPPTPGNEKETIIGALDKLQAGGSTAGGAGIKLAYDVAAEHFRNGGNNRVILATDGDFNIGESSNAAMEELIEHERETGVYLTVLGFGMGNYKDSKMETLADKGNGNYAYIDNINEARKVLVNEFGGTLFTIAKDVKLQIEFNPAKVQAYRLIGYENRVLKNEDFNNDKKDAGDLGAGHTVTALYEIIPVGVEDKYFKVDDLKYQTSKIDPSAYKSNEMMTVKFRYKDPEGTESKLIVHPVSDEPIPLAKTSDNFRWSASVAAFGMLLRDSEFLNGYTSDEITELATSARGEDEEGYRREFINMVQSFGTLAHR